MIDELVEDVAEEFPTCTEEYRESNCHGQDIVEFEVEYRSALFRSLFDSFSFCFGPEKQTERQ